MILTAQTSSFLPDIAFFKKAIQSDYIILLDNAQYSKKSCANRAAIKTIAGEHWLTVPIFTTGTGEQPIIKVVIDNRQDWYRKHLRTLEYNYTNAPYFYRYFDFFIATYQQSWERLQKLNQHCFDFLLSQFRWQNKKVILSSTLPWIMNRTERVIKWLQLTGCKTYLMRADEKDLVNCADIVKNGFDIIIQNNVYPEYHQQFGTFIKNTSIIDLLFNEGDQAHDIILKSVQKNFKLLKK